MNASAMQTARVLYRHRQAGWAMVGIAALPLAFLALRVLTTHAADRSLPHGLLVGMFVLSGVVLFGFSSMSVIVTREHVVARFGIGLVKRSIALDRIAWVEATRSRWYDGWGIHWTRRGTLYNVSGFGVVRLVLVDGKAMMLGTDDANRLRSAIARAIAARSPHG
jgi:hypothetical protein